MELAHITNNPLLLSLLPPPHTHTDRRENYYCTTLFLIVHNRIHADHMIQHITQKLTKPAQFQMIRSVLANMLDTVLIS